MADQNLLQIYTANPYITLDDEDLLYIMGDPSGTPEDAAIRKDKLYDQIYSEILADFDGWQPYSAVVPTRASADDPTYVLTFAGVDLTGIVSVGMRLKWTQNSTVRYGIVTAISFSTNTTLTLYGGTDYDVDDTASYAISNFHYSAAKAPLGFPLDHTKWSVEVTDTTTYTKTSPTNATWYNAMDSGSLPSIDVPIGAWDVYYEVLVYSQKAAATAVNMFCTLSVDAGGSITEDKEWSTAVGVGGASGSLVSQTPISKRNPMVLTTKDTYYLNVKTTNSADDINVAGASSTTKIRAVCSYL